MLSVEKVKADAMSELTPMIAPALEFIAYIKKCLANGVDAISTAQIANWLFAIPTMYGELRCIEVDCLLTAELMENSIDKVKADALANKADGVTVTDARAAAAQVTHDFQVNQSVAKFMARYVNAIWSQFEMLIFSVRNVYESRMLKVSNDVQ